MSEGSKVEAEENGNRKCSRNRFSKEIALAAEVASETGSVQLLPGLDKSRSPGFFFIQVLRIFKETRYPASLFFIYGPF